MKSKYNIVTIFIFFQIILISACIPLKKTIIINFPTNENSFPTSENEYDNKKKQDSDEEKSIIKNNNEDTTQDLDEVKIQNSDENLTQDQNKDFNHKFDTYSEQNIDENALQGSENQIDAENNELSNNDDMIKFESPINNELSNNDDIIKFESSTNTDEHEINELSNNDDMIKYESSINDETQENFFIQSLKNLFLERIKIYNDNFSGKIGIVVRLLKNNNSVFEYNEDKCFIPASLTKIIVCSALFEMLRGSEGNNDPEIFFQEMLKTLNWKNKAFNYGLKDLLKKTNHYSFKQAPTANKTANAIGKFLESSYQINNFNIKLEKILINHLDKISYIQNCNRIENASGLTLYNKIAPYQIADCMFHLKDYEYYIMSLIMPGQGTLKKRLLDIEGSNYFKTGSLRASGVLCLAGYLLDNDFPTFFVIIINNVNSYEYEDTVQWIDELVRDYNYQSVK